MRSTELGALALVMEFFSYFTMAVYTCNHSQVFGIIMCAAIVVSEFFWYNGEEDAECSE